MCEDILDLFSITISTLFRNPRYAPTNVSGTDTQNHNANNAIRVLNGTAPLLPLLHNTKFMTKNNPNTTLNGNKKQNFNESFAFGKINSMYFLPWTKCRC